MLDKEFFIQFFEKFSQYIFDNKEYLTELDSAIGDADHGINMSKGCNAALEKIKNVNFKSVSEMFKTIAMALMSSVGGASGPLYSTIFMKMSLSLNKDNIGYKDLADALKNSLDGIKALGKANIGDKTMVDVWEPVVTKLNSSLDRKENIVALKSIFIDFAKKSMEDTIPVVARKGRASYLGQRSAGHQDPWLHLLISFSKRYLKIWSKTMIGVLILSHSELIAKGLLETCKQMAKEVHIEAVGGINGRLGLDAELALKKLEILLSTNNKVVIYADIGSTILSAKSIKELSSKPEDVFLANAPLIEGSIAGSIEIYLKSPAEKVLEESKKACLIDKT